MITKLFDDKTFNIRGKIAGLFTLLIVANIAAWAWAWTAFHEQSVLLGTAMLAWVFGLRHAVDVDHIAAIDNTVRKLMQEGKWPLTVGFFFSLGHSTVVVLASMAIAAVAASLQGNLLGFADIGGVIGMSVSAVFLLLIALINLNILISVWRSFRRVSLGGTLDAEALDVLLAGRGFLARIFRPLFRLTTRSWHMYPIGFLFGLGFDTATEVGLLGISASQASHGMSAWQIFVFPALFTAGMTLVDCADSVLMVGAYNWAFVHPIRKLWYNLTMTAGSVAVAVLIGGIELLGLIADRAGLSGGFWSVISGLSDDLTNFGFAIIGVFVCAWLLSAVIYRWKRYERLTLPEC